MSEAIGYLRVSTHEQGRKRWSASIGSAFLSSVVQLSPFFSSQLSLQGRRASQTGIERQC
jgi:hypothetical protein